MTGRTFYVSSLENARFEPVWERRVETLLTLDTGKAAVWARHERVSLDPITESRASSPSASLGPTSVSSTVRSVRLGVGEAWYSHDHYGTFRSWPW
jgi:hypothetical protein